MRKPLISIAFWLPALALAAMLGTDGAEAGGSVETPAAQGGPVPVEVVRIGDRYELLRGGKPYEIKGAGLEFGNMQELAAHGGNSFRTWRTDNARHSGMEVLDLAAKYGLTVALCIDIGRERHGFDYDDEEAVAAQLEYARQEVVKYKDHPALLAWIIGNEPNHSFKNPKVFDAINEISQMIHEVDGKHPTTTALAGFNAELAGLIDSRAPDLDFISIQMYGDIVHLPRILDEIAYDRPYFVTEWGAVGYWEAPETDWGAPIEHNSTEKAANYLRSHQVAIASDPEHAIGSYVFLWGQKQERTPTWFGMFLEDGSETEAIDVMHFIWNGKWPSNRSPQILGMLLDARTAPESVVLPPGGRVMASVSASDPDGDPLEYRWELMHESKAQQEGGDREEVPESLEGFVHGQGGGEAELTVPEQPGAYRLFVYVYDGKGHAGHANIPFLVR